MAQLDTKRQLCVFSLKVHRPEVPGKYLLTWLTIYQISDIFLEKKIRLYGEECVMALNVSQEVITQP